MPRPLSRSTRTNPASNIITPSLLLPHPQRRLPFVVDHPLLLQSRRRVLIIFLSDSQSHPPNQHNHDPIHQPRPTHHQLPVESIPTFRRPRVPKQHRPMPYMPCRDRRRKLPVQYPQIMLLVYGQDLNALDRVERFDLQVDAAYIR